jgi:uncharacterized protein involved in exopolysaccharide biosynthesis
MQNPSLNLVSAVAVLRQRWTTLFFFVVASTAVAAVTVFVVPPYYRSQATVVPANTVLSDKAHLFNNRIQQLYSYFGSGDDMDRMVGIGEMDNTYHQLVKEFALVEYYRLSGDSIPVLEQKAVKLLRKDLGLQKNENAQLEIQAWTKDKQLSAKLVNRMVTLIEDAEKNIWQNNYTAAQESLNRSIASMETSYKLLADSVTVATPSEKILLNNRMQTMLEQMAAFHKTADEFMVAEKNIPAALYVLEPASPAAYAQRPDKPAIIAATAIASLLFGCMLVLLGDSKKFS